LSEPKLISPLLDGFIMGQPISDHHGIRCCPAMKEETGEKYIVKIISVPDSQSKLEALLLAGAFQDEAAAKLYFKELAEGIVEDAVLLQRLARLEGFVSYENWQVAPMEAGTGYEVYLIAPYRPTLEKFLQKNPMTHLNALNLGLDLCSALAACRRSGLVYCDLRPGNIYICDNQEFRIGDLGFIAQESLPYASLPDKYISDYTPPEISDAYSSLNATLDIYAVGRVLYQVYNGGVLPAFNDALAAPEYADYEMAEIILKACAVDPAQRWQDPTEMGQALVNYMQQNGVNDTPIIPPVIPIPTQPEAPNEGIMEPEEYAAEEDVPELEEETAGEDIPESEEETAGEDIPESEEEIIEEEISEPEEDAPVVVLSEVPEEAEETGITKRGSVPAEEAPLDEEDTDWEQLSLEDLPPDDRMAEAMAAAEVSDEVCQMLAQADDLIAHETPGGVIPPEPINVPVPAPIAEEEAVAAAEDTEEGEEVESLSATAEEDEPESVESEEIPEDTDNAEAESAPILPLPAAEKRKKKSKKLGIAIAVILAILLFVGGWLFYQHYYLQTILAIDISGSEDRLTVSLNTEVADDRLTVVCTDSHGNTYRQKVSEGVAKFSGLKPQTWYTITVEIDGFHKLIGKTSEVYITPEETNIIGFNAVTGDRAGSVILSFSAEGKETNQWQIIYYAKGEIEKTVTFSGNRVTIDGLSIGKNYSFQLEPVADVYVTGTTSIDFTVTKILTPENLTVKGFVGNALTVTWDTPAGESVESWEVLCYNGMGYEKTVTVAGNTAVFEELDPTTAYTVEVSATGMSTFSRVSISANSVTVRNLSIDGTQAAGPVVTWEFEGNAPAGGWLVLYSIAGMDVPLVVKTEAPSATLPPLIPGSTYDITIQAASGADVFGGKLTWAAKEAESFSGYLVQAKHIKLSMCLTPTKSKWTYKDVKKYTTQFNIGDSASFTMNLEHEYDTSSDKITVLYLIRDEAGNIISCNTETFKWKDMWSSGWGKLTVPAMPETAGSYSVSIYFNAGFVNSLDFTVI